MIIVKFTSGLGNQMFQYNLYSYLKEKYPDTKVKADITWFGRSSEHQGFELIRLFKRTDNPEFQFDVASCWDIFSCTGRFPNTIDGALGDIWQNILKVPHNLIRIFAGNKYSEMKIDQSGFEDNQEIYDRIAAIDPSKNYYISGFYIEDIYYRERLGYLKRVLTFSNDDISDNNRNYISEIEKCESVSIHVRRGDYLSPKYNKSFIALPMDYYKEAVERCCRLYENPHFFIFSDDKEYIEKEFDWISNKTIVEGNTGNNSYRDMQLMSLCKSNIIANSTFSVWAGLLNRNSDAHIFYPRIYMHEKDSEIKSIYNWTRIG